MANKFKRVSSDLPRGANYYVERREVKAGDHFAPHWHDYFEFEIVIEGTGEHIYNNERYALQRGDAYLMSYYDFHELRATSDMVLMKIQFNEHILSRSLNDFIVLSKNRFCVHFDSDELDGMIRSFDMLRSEASKKLLFFDEMIKSTVSSVIITAVRKSSDAKQNVPSLLQKAVAYLRSNYRSDVTLYELSEILSVTPNYLGSLFLKRLGVSFSDYLNALRLRSACGLLSKTALPVKDIAISSGYNSFEHFEYTFKKKLGCTPLEFRRTNK